MLTKHPPVPSSLRTAAPPDSPAPAPAAIYAALARAPAAPALVRAPRGEHGEDAFDGSLDPYVGCELACTYCFARTSPAFDRRILGREDLPARLERDLESLVAPGHRIALGTATDPYQPFEREREITRRCLRVLARREGIRLSIATKSDLILRDLDLLRVIAQRGSLHVDVSVATVDRRLAAALEPRAPAPTRRLRAVRTLAAEGIETGVVLEPVIPGLTDGPHLIEDVAEAASCAGARYLRHGVLRVPESIRDGWIGRLRERWPALVGRHRRWYGTSASVNGAPGDPGLEAALARRVARARRRHRLAEGPANPAPADPQLVLPFAG